VGSNTFLRRLTDHRGKIAALRVTTMTETHKSALTDADSSSDFRSTDVVFRAVGVGVGAASGGGGVGVGAGVGVGVGTQLTQVVTTIVSS